VQPAKDTQAGRGRGHRAWSACGFVAALGVLTLPGCGGGSGGSDWYRPAARTTWQIQLLADAAHPLDTGVDAELYDVDLFDTEAATIAALHADGRKVICYFSTAWEQWRPDADDFPAAVKGNDMDGWPGEKWVDIRDPAVLGIMERRMDLARAKGCDGVDPDNVHAYELGALETGFELTAADQLSFNRALAGAAHARGLAIGLKNDLSQVAALVQDFDFSINEQCYYYDECDLLQPFVAAGKPVFHLEYDAAYRADPSALCADSLARDHRTLIMPLGLDGSFRIACE